MSAQTRKLYLPTERLLTFTKGSGQIWWDELHGSLEALLEVLSVTLINGVEYKSNICNEGSCCGLCIAKLSDNLSSLPGNQPSSNAPSIYSEWKGYKYDWIKTTVYLGINIYILFLSLCLCIECYVTATKITSISMFITHIYNFFDHVLYVYQYLLRCTVLMKLLWNELHCSILYK